MTTRAERRHPDKHRQRSKGYLDVLNVAAGHLKLTVTEGDEAEIEKARSIIEDMLRRGFSIFIEVNRDEAGNPLSDPVTRRVTAFDPAAMVYLIDEVPAPVSAPAGGEEPKVPAKRGRRKRAVPVTETRATAVGRTAGG